MYTFRDAKLMAKHLRAALAERGMVLSHSDCLELVARQFNFADWNMLSARIEPPDSEGELLIPLGWIVASRTNLANYRLGLDPTERSAALIESRPGREDSIDLRGGETAVLMQSVDADDYRGKRLRLSASLKTEAVDLATIWMRVDRAPGQVLRFDNMVNRPRDGALRGTNDWTDRCVVLDVPEDATSLHFGFFLEGLGRCWARGFALAPVGPDIDPTSIYGTRPPRPTNLDFGAGA